jgi:hypothetical protein
MLCVRKNNYLTSRQWSRKEKQNMYKIKNIRGIKSNSTLYSFGFINTSTGYGTKKNSNRHQSKSNYILLWLIAYRYLFYLKINLLLHSELSLLLLYMEYYDFFFLFRLLFSFFSIEFLKKYILFLMNWTSLLT